MLRKRLFAFLFLLNSCNALLPGAPEPTETLAGPVDGLSEAQLAMHLVGDDQFGKTFAELDGLGPIFVSTSCESCHLGDGKGHALTTLTRFGRYEDGVWNPMLEEGGPQLQQFSIDGFEPEGIPSHATGVAKIMPPAVTGLGYLEAIPDSAILAREDPTDADGDGISGIAHFVDAPEYFVRRSTTIERNGKIIGRFGNKAASVDLLHQTSKAYVEDMGITSDFIMQDRVNHRMGNNTTDHVADPEITASVVNSVVFYLRTLKVPPRRNPQDPLVKLGESIFANVGCTGCHLSSQRTGRSDIAALSEQEIHPFTDLLLHDMGSQLDDKYTEGSALSSEWRTAPLWGMGLAKTTQGGVPRYMHDGRASTLEQAIELHGGEAANTVGRYYALSPSDKAALIKFLESL